MLKLCLLAKDELKRDSGAVKRNPAARDTRVAVNILDGYEDVEKKVGVGFLFYRM